jgi:ribonuclease BN (tRNA processing enzyme)
MKIKVLGCSGAEFPGHHPPGFLVDGKILLDAGTLSGVLEEKGQRKIKSIFITHAHMDHIREIPFLADNNIIGGWGHTVHIFSILPVVRDIKKNLLNFKLWPDMTVLPTAHDAVIQLHSLPPERPYKTMDYTVTPYRVRHSVPAVGYLVEDRKGRRFFYTGDTGQMDSTWKRVGETALHGLIIETSFPNRMEGIARMTGHLTPLLLREELKKIRIPPERILITHLKPQFYRVIQAELKALRLKNLRLLKEGETITL